MAGGQNVTVKAPKAASIRAMTSAYGRVIPIVYGKGRVQANVMYYTDFTAIEHKSKKKTGGKGGGGSQTNIDYTYTVCALFGLVNNELGTCSLGNLWVGKEKGSASSFGLSFFNGSSTQTAMSYIQTKHPTEALNYRGTAYVGASAFDLGNDASMPSINAEIIGRLSGSGSIGSWTGGDANPVEIIADLLSNKYGFTLNNTGDALAYCQAYQIFASPVYVEAKPFRELVSTLAKIANCGIYFSESLVKIVPFGDTALTANGATYTPYLTPAYDLTENDFMADGDGSSLRCMRKAQADAYNYVKVTYQNRANDYNDDVVEAKDQAAIENYGLRAMSEVSLPEIADTSVARVVAQNILQRAQNIRNVYEFKVDWRFSRLEPMDIVTLTETGLGLDHEMVRIIEVEELDDGLRIKAEEMQIGAHTVARYTTQTSDGYVTDFNVAPGHSSPALIFEPPTELTGSPQIWMGVTPATTGQNNWGGCNVWVSTDNATYQQIGIIQGAARGGTITSAMAYAAGSGPTTPDTTSVCRASIPLSKDSIDSGSSYDAARYVTLCVVDGELFSYRDSALVSTGVYDLTYLYRGLYGTSGVSHLVNAPFLRLDDSIFKFDYSGLDDTGYSLYFKFQSFNVYGGGVEDLSSLTAYNYAINGAVAPGIGALTLTSDPDDENIIITWPAVKSARYYVVNVYDSTGTTLYRSVNTNSNRFTFLWQETANLSGGPYRSLQFKVSVVSDNGQSGLSSGLVVTNPVPSALAGIKVTGGYGIINFQWTPSPEKDLAGYQVWMSNTSGFTPGSSNLLVDTADNIGSTRQWNNSGVFTDLAQGSTYYFRAAAYDRYGKTGLNVSSEIAVTVLTIATGIGPGEITSTMIAAGAVGMTQMASSVRPPRVVSSLPTVDGTTYKNGDTVTLTTDGQLYRAFGGAWVTEVPAVNVTGTLSDSQLAAISAAKVTGTLSDSQLAAISAAKVTGTLSDSQLAAISAAKVTGTIVNSQIASMDAAKLTSQITSTQIANGAISTPKLAAGAVTANEIAANTITTAKMAASSITATELAAGSVVAGKIAAGAVTAGTVAASSITATELAAGSVVAGKIAAGAVTAGTIAANAVTATEIAAGSIVTAKLAAGAVTANEIAANAVTATQIQAGAVTTAKLAAGAVTANEIAANTITAAKIAAGAIGASQIAANAITADKLYVQVNGTALNTNPSCDDATAWTNTGSSYSVVNITDGVSGIGALRSSTARNTSWPTSTFFPITAGKTYRVQAWARGVNASPGNLYLRCLRINSASSDVSSGGSVGLENFAVSGTWTQYTGTFVAESTAVKAQLQAPMNWGGTANTAYIEIQDFRCEEFIPGTLIMDGAITTNKVAANAITAGKIAANTITANEIAANTITGTQIAANTVTATNIDSRGLTIKDASGTVIFSAGVPLAATYASTSLQNSAISIGSNGVLSGAGGGAVTIGGLGYTGALNATKNTVTYSASAPGSPSDGDIWTDTSVSPNITRVRVSGAWQVGANYVTNTNQVTDGAGLGTTAVWSNVSGTGKPADNATVGASFGVNISGQITSGNVSTYIANAAIQAAHIGSLNANVINAGTITTDKLVVGAASQAAVQGGGNVNLTVGTTQSTGTLRYVNMNKSYAGSTLRGEHGVNTTFTTSSGLTAGWYEIVMDCSSGFYTAASGTYDVNTLANQCRSYQTRWLAPSTTYGIDFDRNTVYLVASSTTGQAYLDGSFTFKIVNYQNGSSVSGGIASVNVSGIGFIQEFKV